MITRYEKRLRCRCRWHSSHSWTYSKHGVQWRRI